MSVASLASIVFNKNLLKFVAALSIPAGIAWLFFYSQHLAELEVDSYKKEQKVNPVNEQTIVEDYAMKEIDDLNRIRWQLVAKRGTMLANNRDIELVEVNVEYFDPTTKELKMRLVAPFGQANQQTKYVKLQGKDGIKVIAEGQGGKAKLTAQVVELIKKNQFLASGGVIIDWPGVAKVTGDSASGTTDLSSGPKDFKVIGNTHAEIVMK